MKWGCAESAKSLSVFVTNASNSILRPGVKASLYLYSLPGYYSDSSEVVFNDFPSPLQLSSGQALRLWFSEDYPKYHEFDNGRTTCADVFAKYL